MPAGSSFDAATLNPELRAESLVCNEVCIPERGNFFLQVPAATRTLRSAAPFAQAQARLPIELPSVRATARVAGRYLEMTAEGLPAGLRGRSLRLFPEQEGSAPFVEFDQHARCRAGAAPGAAYR